MSDETKKEIDDLTAELLKTDTLHKSGVALVKGLADRFRKIAADRVKVEAFADDLKESADALAAAVAAKRPY